MKEKVRMVDKLAFVALTACNQASVEDLERLHDRTSEADRTAFLDQHGGSKEFVRKIYDHLIEVGLQLRSDGEMVIDRVYRVSVYNGPLKHVHRRSVSRTTASHAISSFDWSTGSSKPGKDRRIGPAS